MSKVSAAGDPSEPDTSFRHARWKVRWASERVQSLVAAHNKFVQANTKTALAQGHSQGLLVTLPIVPPQFGLAAGDIIFNLRSALDCCWMGLKRAADAGAKREGGLPRADTRHGVAGNLKNASVEKTFKGADRFILDTIRPYEAGNEALWFAAKADNWNKHNLLLITASSVSVTGVINLPGGGRITFEDTTVEGQGYAMPITISHPGVQYDFKTRPAFEVVFGLGTVGQTRPLMPFLATALQQTHEAVEAFVKTFGKDAGEVTNPEANA